MSLLKAWKSATSVNGTPESSPPRVKKGRFSLFTRQSPRRAEFGAAHEVERSASTGSYWTASNDDRVAPGIVAIGGGGGRDVNLERSFTLSILEGRRITGARRAPRSSTGTSNTCVSHESVSGGDPMLSLSLKVASPPPIPPRSRARSASTSSAHSSSEDGPRRRTTRPRPQPLGLPEVEEPCLDAELLCNPPTYSTAAYPTQAVTYRFAQTGPFALTLEAEGKENALLPWRYHIAVGVNVLTLKSWMTSVRRGGEEGMLVAEIESAISSGSATVTMGDRSRSSKDVLSRTVGSKMYYVGNGTSIRWNLGETRWEAFFDSVELATFDPGPARKMFVQPVAHRFFDHLVVAVLLLMREKEETGGCGTDAGPVPPSRL